GVTGATDKALFGQLSGYPSALGIAAALLTLMAMIPGIPAWPFLTMAALAGTAAFLVSQANAKKKLDEESR
ncbi:MAG TPA: hypothetical protein DCL95_14530, partial [Rhodospirillaceae bacterium]|nr:hypothetical protein [Rhodospirillaceae bacterium]